MLARDAVTEHDETAMHELNRNLRRRRRRYARTARRQRLLGGLSLPHVIQLPGGRRFERQVYLFWRIRLPLWALFGLAGWLFLGWLGAVIGLVAAILVEVLFSFRRPHGLRPMRSSPPPPARGGGSAGVREPRRPHPTRGAGSAELPVDPLP